jgi:hypothetical protein
MTEPDQNLELFFGLQTGDGHQKSLVSALADAARKTIKTAATQTAALHAIVERGIPKEQWAAAGTELTGQLRTILGDLSLSKLLTSGWATYEPLLEYCNAEKHPPNERAVVSLKQHTVTSSHHPFIVLRVDGMTAGRIDFDVEFSATFDIVALVIQGGRIMAAQPGSVSASGTIKCDNLEVLQRPLGKLELPGRISFGDGIPINPLRPGSASASDEKSARRPSQPI